MMLRFLIYGILGWATEISWTAFWHAVQTPGDWRLEGFTNLWMLPIYGLTALLLERIHDRIRDWHWLVRGGIYVAVIFSAEYLSGFLLRQFIGVCPWDYSHTPYHIDGLIRLDYAPAWFAAGLLFEIVHNRLNLAIPQEYR